MEINDENIKMDIKELDKKLNTTKNVITNDTKLKENSKKIISLNDSPDNNPKKIQRNINRCMTCNKKIGLLGFQCKCELYFCSEHRYSDRHDCTFDYKSHGKELIAKTNPIIISKKIDII